MLYKSIGDNKWLKVKPHKLHEKYYKYELDKKDNAFTGKVFMWHEIIISDTNPNKRVS